MKIKKGSIIERFNSLPRVLLALSGCVMVAGLSACSCDGPIGGGPPEAPTVDQPESPTRENSQVLRGSKQSATAIHIDGEAVVELSDSSSWSATVGLNEGRNTFQVTAVDGNGEASSAVEVLIVADFTAPAPPVLTPEPPSATSETSFLFTGTREAESSVWMNGVEIVELGSETTWSHEVALSTGDNEFRFTAQDFVGNESEVLEVNIATASFSFSVNAFQSLVNETPVNISGNRGAQVAVLVDDVEAVEPEDETNSWSVQLDLSEGTNTFVFAGQLGEETGGETTVVITLDTTAPSVPVLDPIPEFTDNPLLYLSGTKDADSSLIVNGTNALAVSSLTSFSNIPVNLVEGLNTLTVVSGDAIGNLSDAVTPAPTIVYSPDGVYLTVDTVPELVGESALVLSGERGTNVDVYIDAQLVSEADGSTASWSHTVTLQEGANTIQVEGRSGDLSTELSVEVLLDTTPPAAPTVDYNSGTSSSTITVTGTKEMDTAIIVKDAEDAIVTSGNLTSSPSFSTILTLEEGDNTFFFYAEDGLDRLSEPTEVNIYFSDTAVLAELIHPSAMTVVNDILLVSGTAFHPDGVAEITVYVEGEEQGTLATLTNPTNDLKNYEFTAQVDLSDSDQNGLIRQVDVDATDNGVGVSGVVASVDILLVNGPIAMSGGEDFASSSNNPTFSIKGDNGIALAFQDNSESGDFQILMNTEDNAGSSSERGEMVTLNTDGDYSNGTNPALAVTSDGVVHTIWRDDGTIASQAAGFSGLVYRSWDGATLSDPVILAVGDAGQSVFSPDMTVGSNDQLAVTWEQGNTIYLKIYDGTAWGDAIEVNAPGDVDTSFAGNPRIMMDSAESLASTTTVHLVWQDYGDEDGDGTEDFDLYYRRYEIQAQTFSDIIVITPELSNDYYNCDASKPALALVPGDQNRLLYVAWLESGGINAGPVASCETQEDLHVALRTVDNSAFDPTLPILGAVYDVSNTPGHVFASAVALTADAMNNVRIAWSDAGGNINGSGADFDIFVRGLDGNMLSDVSSISDLDGDVTSVAESTNPQISLDGYGNTHLIWGEAADIAGSISGGGDTDVMYYAVPYEL